MAQGMVWRISAAELLEYGKQGWERRWSLSLLQRTIVCIFLFSFFRFFSAYDYPDESEKTVMPRVSCHVLGWLVGNLRLRFVCAMIYASRNSFLDYYLIFFSFGED